MGTSMFSSRCRRLTQAARQYADEVRNRKFPDETHSYR